MRSPLHCLSALCIMILSGCHTYQTATISVKDKNGSPVSGASVHAAPMYFFNPTNESYLFVGSYDILEPFTAQGDAATTAADGTTQIQVVERSPLQIQIFATQHKTWQGSLEITKQGTIKLQPTTLGSTLNVTAK